MTSPIRKAVQGKRDVPHTMAGIIESTDGYYFTVVCKDAPAHLQTLNLIRKQLGGAAVGDRVELAYTVTSNSGLWNVSKILERKTADEHEADRFDAQYPEY